MYPLCGVVAQWLERWCVSLVWRGSSVVGALVCIPCVAWWLSGWSAGVYPLWGVVAQWLEHWCVSLVGRGSSVVGAPLRNLASSFTPHCLRVFFG